MIQRLRAQGKMDTQWLEERERRTTGQRPRRGHKCQHCKAMQEAGCWQGGHASNGTETSGLLGGDYRLLLGGGVLSWGTGGKSQREVAMAAGCPCHDQNAENAGSLPQHVPQRKQMPRAGVGGGREQEQAGCPGPPPHTCCPLIEGQALTWKGKRGQDCDPFTPLDTVSPT